MKMKKILLLFSLFFISLVLISCQEDEVEKDVVPPTIIGTKNIDYIIGNPVPNFLDGISAYDNIDGNITHLIIVDETLIDLTTGGVYTLTYRVTDQAGNTETKIVSLTVIEGLGEVDLNAPVIIGTKHITYEFGSLEPNYLLGVTAFDLEDGYITDDIVLDDSLVDLTTLGIYDVTYFVADQAQNSFSITIEVTVVDTTPPVISGLSDLIYYIGSPMLDFSFGITATDLYDGDLTDSIEIDSSDFDHLTVGLYTITYQLIDSSSNTTTESIEIEVRLSPSPQLFNTKDFSVEVHQNAPDYLDGITAVDYLDNDLTDLISVDDSNVDLTRLGTYQLIYKVIDQALSSTEITVNVVVVDTTAPVFHGLDMMTYYYGDPYPDFREGITATDLYDGDLTALITINIQNFDDWVLGTYSIIYTVTDSSNNSNTVTITIDVIDNTKPVLLNTIDYIIALEGEHPDYLDGLISYDDYDGNLTDLITVDYSLVNLEQVGIYKVYLSVSDFSGNITTKSINVYVLDQTPPVISGTKNHTHIIGDEEPDLLEGVTAIDYVDGDITSSIELQLGGLDFDVAGLYIITYVVTDYANNRRSIQVTVTVVDPNQPDTINTLNVFYINDTHGAILENDAEMGMAKIGNLVLTERAVNPLSTLFIGGGDLLQGTLVSNYFNGASMIDSLNYIGLDAFVLGNHEFDWGIEIVTNYRDPANPLLTAEFPLLGANIFYEGTQTRPDYIDAYTIVQKGNIKVGIIGLMGFGLESSIANSRVDGYSFANPTFWAAHYTEHLRVNENVDIVIVVIHDDGRQSGFNQNLSSWTGNQRVDAVFNGHSHQEYSDLINRSGVKMPSVQSSSNGRKVGKVTFSFDHLGLLTQAEAINLSESNESRLNTVHPGLNDLINTYVQQIEPLLNDVIIVSGQSANQSALTLYMAKLMRIATDSDIGFHNLGGTRSFLTIGQDITVATLYKIFPFDNRIKTTYLTGAQIQAYISSYGGFNDIKPGVSFISNQYYKVATNDYVFDQPDNPFITGINTEDTGILIRDLLATIMENQAEAGLTFMISHPIVLFGNRDEKVYYLGNKKETEFMTV
jgi:2',3'-cyclic-nucleotide 2'-phosphodiesterase (5'-nucleotidase family)